MSKTPKSSFTSLRAFWIYISGYKLRLVLVVLVFVVSNTFLAVIPLLIGELVNALTNNQSPWLYVILLAAVSVLHDSTWQVANMVYRHYILPFSFHYETLLFKHVLEHPYHYFTDKFTGKLSSHISTISQGLRDLLSEAYFNYSSQVVVIISIIFILGTVNKETVILFVACLLLMFIVGRITVRKAIATERIETDTISTKNGHIVDSISNYPSVKSFFREPKELKHLMAQQEKSLTAAKHAFLWNMLFWWSMGFFVRWLFWPIAIGMNVMFYLDDSLTLGQLATLLSTALIFTNTIWEIIWSLSQFSIRAARIEEAYHYLFGKSVIKASDRSSNTIIAPDLERSLTLRNLSFSYPDKPEDLVLNNLTLTITHGQKVGVVGRSGSGKSTLTKILLGHYDQTAGDILVDRIDVSTKELAQLIAYVPQDTSLFHRSIADNIAYAANHQATREEVVEAAKSANADEFIRQIKGGYEALVGERGAKLSGGQRQRIAIARAIIKNTPLLVLDEATSALDSESEVLVQQALEKLWQDKTAIVIAHRLSTIAKLDRIIVLEKGRIIEDGTHTELIQKNGTYAKLWSHQSGGFIEE